MHLVTPDDVAKGRFTPRDIVLPLPSNDMVYPPKMKDFYIEKFRDDGIVMSQEDEPFSVKLLSFKLTETDERKLFEFPRNSSVR